MSDFLGRMAAASRERVATAKRREPESNVQRHASSVPPPPRLWLSRDGFDLFAEYKRRTPSTGQVSPESGRLASLRDRVFAYAMGGAVAISVLTEPNEFYGSLSDLSAAAQTTRLPTMRKDFITDPYQVFETRAAGGAGILLVVRILDDACLRDVISTVAECGLFVVLEAFDEVDLSRATVAARQSRGLGVFTLVGLNARNLKTLQTERSRLRQLRTGLPIHCPRVAESSLTTPDHAAEAARCGYDVALVGSALMRAPDPTRIVAAMIAAGRAERTSSCAFE